MSAPLGAVVVGGGVAGLTAGLVLAASGRSVAVVEQDRQLGGYCTSFRRGGFTFDSVVDGVSGLAPGGPLRRVLALGGVDAGALVLDLPVARSAFFGEERLDFPADGEACRRVLRARVPGEGTAIDRVFEALLAIAAVAGRGRVADLWAAEGARGIERDHPFARWRDRTYAELLDDAGVRDPRLRLAFSERLMFLGGGPERVSAVSAANLLGSTWRFGCQRVRGGLYRIVNAMAAAIRGRGGMVRAGDPVESVAPEGRGFAVVSPRLGTVQADRVVVACDPLGFFERIWRGPAPEGDALPRARAFPRSCSFFLGYLAVRGGWPGVPPSFGVFTDPSRVDFEDSALEGPAPAYGVGVASEVDPSLAPAGFSTVVVHAFLPAGREVGAADRARLKARALALVERRMPGLEGRLEWSETAGPFTLERYTRNPGGAAYGFAQTPARFPLVRDLVAALPRGLHLAGHWTDYGGGVLASALSGFGAARAILAAPAPPGLARR